MKEILEFGRVRLYEINFGYDSNIMKDESKSALDFLSYLNGCQSISRVV